MGRTGETCQDEPNSTLIHEELVDKQQSRSTKNKICICSKDVCMTITSVCLLIAIFKRVFVGAERKSFAVDKSNVPIQDVYFPTLQHFLSFPVSSTLLLLPSFPPLL